MEWKRNKYIIVKFDEKNKQIFKSYKAVVKYMKRNAIPWNVGGIEISNLQYMKDVADRFMIVYGCRLEHGTYRNFLIGLDMAGELSIKEIIEITLEPTTTKL